MDAVFPVTFNIFGIPIRDTVISTWVMVALILFFVNIARKKMPEALEQLIEFVSGIASDSIGRTDVSRFVPFLGTLVLFIAVGNIFGVLPIMQTPTKDINTTLACALVVFFAVHIFGVMERGVFGYLKMYTSPLAILDVIGQVSRTMSLTLRLFGNVISGEIIAAVIFSLVKPVASLPLVILGMVTGILQAYIFIVLTSGYIAAVVKQE